jgi:hypothetical protein
MRAVLKTQNMSSTSLKDINTKQNSVIKQSDQMSKSINNLSTSITKSVSNLASAAARGTGNAVGSAGSAVVGAASSVSSSIVSVLAKTLPFAIAGVVGKMFVYDKMDDSVKKQLGESFSGLMSSIFGDVDTSSFGKIVKPITKEISIVFGALGDTLSGLSKKVSEMVDILSKSVGGITGIQTPGRAVEIFDKAKQNAKVLGTTSKDVGSDIAGVYEAISDISVSDVGTAVQYATGAAAAVGATAILTGKGITTPPATPPVAPTNTSTSQSKMGTAEKPRNLDPKEIARMQQAMQSLSKKGIKKPSLLNLLDELSLSRIMSIGGKPAERFFEFASKFKLSNGGAIIQVALAAGLAYIIYREVDSLYKNGFINESEKSEILKFLAEKEAYMLAGGIIGGTLTGAGLAAATVLTFGAAATPALAVSVPTVLAGTYFGSQMGEEIANMRLKTPDVLTKNYTPLGFAVENVFDPVGSVKHKTDPGGRAKRQGALTPNSASHSTSAMDIVGMSEGGAAGYDAIYGFGGPGGDPSIPKSHGGKNLSQLTIGEVIAIGKSRGKNRGALGKYQFMPSVLEYLLAPAGLTKNDIFSPDNQDHLYKVFTQLNGMELQRRGVELTAENLHLAHAVGAGGAAKLLKADPNAIAADVLGFEVGSAARDTNPQLEKPTSEYIASITGKYQNGNMPLSQSSIAQAATSSPTLFSSYDDNYARRKKEAKEAEKYEEGSDTFVGPPSLKETKQSPNQFAGMSLKQFTSDFTKRTQDLTSVFEEIFASQNSQQVPMISTDQSTNINQVNSSGGGGGPSISSVISGNMADRNWQFNALAGSSTA